MQQEWLETDGLGGFASGTVAGIRSRRYHALLLSAATPPTGRVVLVNGVEVFVQTPNGRFPLSSQQYNPDVLYPNAVPSIETFQRDPWPTWRFRLPDGTRIEHSLFIPHGQAAVVLSWRLLEARPDITLSVRPLLTGRDYHALHHENGSFQFKASVWANGVQWKSYDDLFPVVATTNGAYRHEPTWYRNFLYAEEKARGLDFTEDCASPGSFEFNLSAGEAVHLFSTQPLSQERSALEIYRDLRHAELVRRGSFISPLDQAADAYIVARNAGKTIVAGYPWFTDWGRDTFIALRGLCLATERWDVARQILVEWSGVVSQGMLPNLFPDRGTEPEYNSVDASLWYVVAVHDFLQLTAQTAHAPSVSEREKLIQAVLAIVSGYVLGTRFGIRADQDGLLFAGEPGVQLTWMDAKVGSWVVTPRWGKPVEIQALWINALRIAGQFDSRLDDLACLATQSFQERFWSDEKHMLADVVDVNGRPGEVDWRFRPNQIFAVGGLPFQIVGGERAKQIVEHVERELWTPLGLRSLAPSDRAYVARYQGGVLERDGSYHQGTVWPWLAGPFVEAWLRVHPGQNDEAYARWVQPLLDHLDDAGLGHVSEIADADAPHTPRGCPFQAWSVGELIRVTKLLTKIKEPV